MRKLSKKAKRLIIDYSSAAADLTNKAIRPNFIQFGEARAALMDYIAELEAMVEQLIWVGNDLLIDNANPFAVVLFNGLVAKAKEKESEE